MSDQSRVDTLFAEGGRQLAEGRMAEAIATFGALLALAPDDWQALANRALAHYRAGAHDKALDDYCRALELQPASVNLLANFAVLLKELGQLELAESLLQQALQLDPKHADAWSNLGIVRQHRLQYDSAAQCHIQAIQIAGESPARWTNLGNAFTGGLHLAQAVEAYENALKLDAGYHEARYNMAIPLLTMGRYAEAWPAYESRWNTILTPRFTDARWQGEALGNDTLLLWSEQGLGDSLQMARFIPLIRAAHPSARLILSCPVSLHRLFAVFDGVECVGTDESPAFDWQIPLASLPGVFRAAPETLPRDSYLAADPALAEKWAVRLPARRAGKMRVGIVWQSGVWGVGVRDLTRQHKSIPPESIEPLLGLADLVCLQPEPLPDRLAGRLYAPVIGDFADTAAIIANLDLVVSVDTAVAHLAGAMGRPVWVLMRHEGAPFFGASGETAPWYPSARVLRQDAPGDWNPVLARLALQLAMQK